jgi:phosphatidylinositol alpha-1,6-mannosyltransferase
MSCHPTFSLPCDRRAVPRAPFVKSQGCFDWGVKEQDALRVLVLTPVFPPTLGGIQQVAHGVAVHASRARVRVLTIGQAGAEEFDAAQPFELRRTRALARDHRLLVLGLNLRAMQEAARFRPHVVLSVHIVTSLASVGLAHSLGIPYMQYVHADEIGVRPHLARFALRHSAAVVAVSRHAERLARDAGADWGKIYRIPPGVELPVRASGGRAERPTLLTVARLSQRYKGHDIILRALPTIRASVPDVRWVVLGDGPLRGELEETARREGVTDLVHFAGGVSDGERDGWLDRAHVFVMPSRLPPDRAGGEGFGIAYMEASAHGLPVVAGAAGGALDAVVHGETGLLVDPTSPTAVAKAVVGLLLDPSRAQALGEAGAARARDFEWPRIARQVDDLLLAVANSGARGHWRCGGAGALRGPECRHRRRCRARRDHC